MASSKSRAVPIVSAPRHDMLAGSFLHNGLRRSSTAKCHVFVATTIVGGANCRCATLGCLIARHATFTRPSHLSTAHSTCFADINHWSMRPSLFIADRRRPLAPAMPA